MTSQQLSTLELSRDEIEATRAAVRAMPPCAPPAVVRYDAPPDLRPWWRRAVDAIMGRPGPRGGATLGH